MLRGDTEVRRDDRRWQLLLVIVLLVAAKLRLDGIAWGLPDALKSYSYHPDEFLTVGAAYRILQTGLPGFYNYPSLYLYLTAVAASLGSWTGLIPNPYLCARLVTALMGVGAVGATFWAGRVMFGTAAGLIAAAILAIAPLHVQHSHFATVDVPSTLFVALALGFAGLILKRGSLRDYILAGVMAGLAAGTKYNASLVLASLIVAHYLHKRANRAVSGDQRIAIAVVVMALTQVITTPGMFLQRDLFNQGMGYELRHVATGHGLVFAGTGSGFVFTLMNSLWWGLGPALAVMLVAAVAYALWRRDRNVLIILAYALPYYALISIAQVRFARYALPLYPGVALLCAWMAVGVWERLKRGPRWVWAGLCGLVGVSTLFSAVALDGLFTQPDPRDRAARWIVANVSRKESIGIIEAPWFYSPPLSKLYGFGTLPQRREQATRTPFRIAEIVEGAEPDWAVVSDYEVGDALRLRADRSIPKADRLEVERILRDCDLVRRRYSVARVFRDKLSALGLRLGNTEDLPHDMRYPAPTITIYRLRK